MRDISYWQVTTRYSSNGARENSGHPRQLCLVVLNFLICLYNEILELNNGFSMDGKNEDLFFLSNGHISRSILQCTGTQRLLPCRKSFNTFRLIGPAVFKVIQQLMRVCLVFELHSGSLGQGTLRCHWCSTRQKSNDIMTISRCTR